MARFPMKMKLVNQTTKRTESGNSYEISFKYQPRDYYADSLKTTVKITADSKEKIDAIKDELKIINVGEIFYLGVGTDPQKKLDEFFEEPKVLEPSDMFEEFKELIKDLPGNELAPKFYEIKKEIESIEQKKRKSQKDKNRLSFLKECFDHIEEAYYIPPMDPTDYSEIDEIREDLSLDESEIEEMPTNEEE